MTVTGWESGRRDVVGLFKTMSHSGRLFEIELDAPDLSELLTVLQRDGGAWSQSIHRAISNVIDEWGLVEEQRDQDEQRIDGDLLYEVVLDACPPWMASLAVQELAAQVLTGCARTGHFVVTRGMDSQPWTPEPTVEAHACCEHAP